MVGLSFLRIAIVSLGSTIRPSLVILQKKVSDESQIEGIRTYTDRYWLDSSL
jgi:hypothetical protein